MPWRPELNQLRDALAKLYPDVADIQRVAASASLPLHQVTWQGRPANDCQTILEEAGKRGCAGVL